MTHNIHKVHNLDGLWQCKEFRKAARATSTFRTGISGDERSVGSVDSGSVGRRSVNSLSVG